jgi:AbrB family looped-hinge helix DNA binding protein
MAFARITAQRQISVPAAVRQKLGVGRGSVLEWDEVGGKVVVRRSGKYSFEDIRRKVFPDGPPRRLTVEEMDEAIAQEILERHARR